MASNRTIRYTKLMVGSVDVGTHLLDDTKHRVINDSSIASTALWSAQKINAELADIDGSQLSDDSIVPAKLDNVAAPGASQDGYAVTYNHATGEFEWEDISAAVGSDTYMVKWDSGDSAELLEEKIPNPDTASGLEILRMNSGGTAYELGMTIEEPAVTGDATKLVQANAGGTGLELGTKIESPTGSGDATKLVVITAAGDGLELGPTAEQPSAGDTGKVLIVNSAGDGYDLALERISADTTLYLAITGNDTTGDGSSGTPWYSLEKAFDYLKDKWINTDVIVTISIGDGTYTGLSTVYIRHQQSANIRIEGIAQATTILTFSAGESGIDIESSVLGLLAELTLKGDSVAQYGIIIAKNGGITTDYVLLDTWGAGMYLSDWSTVRALRGFHAYNIQKGLHLDRSEAILDATSSIDCNSLSSSRGVAALNGSNIIVIGDVSNADTGFYAHDNSYINADITTTTTVATPYDPAVTTGDTPLHGNQGSWIYKS